MAIEIKVPALGESVTSATVARWMKQAGETIAVDEPLVELETDKVTVDVPAPATGTLETIVAAQGVEVEVGALLGTIVPGAAAAAPPTAKPAAAAPPAPAPTPAEPRVAPAVMPAAAKIAADRGIDPTTLAGTGKDGRITKADVLAANAPPAAPAAEPVPAIAMVRPTPPIVSPVRPTPVVGSRNTSRNRMTRLRATVARRLKEAQNTAAILTTFNEIDMSAVMALRTQYRDAFEKKHGIRLGFMGFFVKACVATLQEFPLVNGAIEGDEVVTHDYVDMGIAVSGSAGLVVPVLRNAEAMSLAEIEAAIAVLGRKARDGQLTLEELAGGTFSITNGGVFGSLLSTPILNPPQSAILGMHKIEERPVVIAGKVEVRPMMYVALSYDHRIVDGREAVSSLVRIKEAVEDPRRLLLDV